MNQVLGHLKAEGYKVSRSKIYGQHDKAFLARDKDGGIPLNTVQSYIKWARLKKVSDMGPDGEPRITELSLSRQSEELRRLKAQADREEFKRDREQGLYIPREDLEQELASRALLLDAGLRRMFQESLADWVFLVEGNPTKVRELQDQIFEQLDGLMNEYANLDSFQVLVDPDAELA